MAPQHFLTDIFLMKIFSTAQLTVGIDKPSQLDQAQAFTQSHMKISFRSS